MKRIIFFISILLHFCAGQAQNTAFPSLEDLDRVVAEQQKYVDIREGRILMWLIPHFIMRRKNWYLPIR